MSVTLLGASEIRRLAAELDVTPTKKLGQNFVVDANTVRRIVQIARVTESDRVVEVGPGLGSLTLAILEAGASVTAVEIDHRLAARLPETATAHGVADGALTVVDADALRVTELPGDPRVLVANLPYNVSVPGAAAPARALSRSRARRRDGAVGSGGAARGAPRVENLRCAERQGGLVRKMATRRDGVAPGVLARAQRRLRARRVRARAQPRGSDADRRAVFAIVDAAFQQRRKMLRQALAAVLGEALRMPRPS